MTDSSYKQQGKKCCAINIESTHTSLARRTPNPPPRAPRTAKRIKTYVYLTWLLLELVLKLEQELELEPESRLALIVSFANCDSHMWRPLVSESVRVCGETYLKIFYFILIFCTRARMIKFNGQGCQGGCKMRAYACFRNYF